MTTTAQRSFPGSYEIALALIGTVALVSQIFCYQVGFYSVSMDESVRARMSACPRT
ncbi:MAG: hypothetical protein ACREJ5_13650 [Geminicoccaceae bacterium]